MICPKCRNAGWEPVDIFTTPIKNLGGKQKYDTFDVRRYTCLNCGFKFLTEEKYSREITNDNQIGLFENE